MTAKFANTKNNPSIDYYSGFDVLDGYHPWMAISPEGYVPYRVRQIKGGKVSYFNYILAKEMGLVPSTHPHVMDLDLERKILSTFAIQIINEYDELSNRKIDPASIKPNKYMATRYLQLQHTNKQGKTSGDGRGIWNGCVKHKGKVWDISSRGTGVTCLAPGAVLAQKPLPTGGNDFGYGCGMAEIDELLGAAILAEIMHLQGIHTERVLCIIDLGKGYGIGVRAAPNLLRPAHIFRYLKQEKYEELKKSVDYFIERQVQNGKWDIKLRSPNKYDQMLKYISKEFAEFAAKLDIDYIFAWLDWDGDNVLADAGIIDYGSVRQFGIRHDKYRYDDIERFSTNLNEQRTKAKYLVQVFAQLVDYLNNKKKKQLKEFTNHEAVKEFDTHFDFCRSDRLLYRIGFSFQQRQKILQNPKLFKSFDKEFSYFERSKISESPKKVADGVNHPALFNMRNILRILPKYYLENTSNQMPKQEFFNQIISSFAKAQDAKMRKAHEQHIEKFQDLYLQLVKIATENQKIEKTYEQMSERSQKLNSDKRITGNALIEIVEEIINDQKKATNPIGLQKIIDRLVIDSSGMPETQISRYFKLSPQDSPPRSNLYNKLLSLVKEHYEDI